MAIDLRDRVADGEVVGRVGTDVDGVAISGTELGYYDLTSATAAITAVGAAARVDIPSLTITITVTSARPWLVRLHFGYGLNSTGGFGGGLAIVEGSTVRAQVRAFSPTAGDYFGSLSTQCRRNDGPGTYTYKAMGWAEGGGSFQPVCAATTPAFIQAIQL
jgi:hypothetical protein